MQGLGSGARDEQAGCGGWLQVAVTEAAGCLEPASGVGIGLEA